ncbi:hypothetical protein Tco_0693058 [Tanacetum coccineum]
MGVKGSKTSKFASTKEPVEVPITEVFMDDAGDEVAHDDNPPQDTSEPKTRKTLNPDWFKQPLRPPTLDPEWNKRQVVLDQPSQPWSPSHRTVAADYFFNNDLEYLKTSDPDITYTTSITKTKAAHYEIKGTKDMVPTLWSTIKHAYDKDAEKGIQHWEGDFVDLHLKNIEDMLLLAVQNKLFHFDRSVVVDFIVALRMFTRNLILKRRVEDLQLGVERIVYEDLNKQKRVLRADELYKFSNDTLKFVRDEIHHRVLEFRLDYNP